jgi:hypothetical protein
MTYEEVTLRVEIAHDRWWEAFRPRLPFCFNRTTTEVVFFNINLRPLNDLPKVSVEWLAVRILEVLVSNLSPETGYPTEIFNYFIEFLQSSAGIVR